MQLYSTNSPHLGVTLKQAVFRGLPEDNGLYMPREIPKLPEEFIKALPDKTFQEIAMEISSRLFGDSIEKTALKKIISEVFNFDLPLVPLEPNVYALELFHGPTLAFKDFGARFMARLMSYFLQNSEKRICILVATSGDTGSAVAQGFYNIPGFEVLILYPSGKVSPLQEKQLTTVGGNVTALEVDGTFDDCQKLVKQAFLDDDLRNRFNLTSANSINIARLIPQSFYYFYIYAQLRSQGLEVVCSVPSGNFGNLMGGLLAKRMGLPINKFIAANNDNRVFYDYLRTAKFNPLPSLTTISNAMDVGNPSNFHRISDLYKNNYRGIIEDITGFTFNDDQTREAIRKVHHNSGYLLDPHGAVGYLGLKKYLESDSSTNSVGVFLATAHPAKFKDIVEPIIGEEINLPPQLAISLKKPKQSIPISNSLADLRQHLQTRDSGSE